MPSSAARAPTTIGRRSISSRPSRDQPRRRCRRPRGAMRWRCTSHHGRAWRRNRRCCSSVEPLPQRVAVRPQAVDRGAPADLARCADAASATMPASRRAEPRPLDRRRIEIGVRARNQAAARQRDDRARGARRIERQHQVDHRQAGADEQRVLAALQRAPRPRRGLRAPWIARRIARPRPRTRAAAPAPGCRSASTSASRLDRDCRRRARCASRRPRARADRRGVDKLGPARWPRPRRGSRRDSAPNSRRWAKPRRSPPSALEPPGEMVRLARPRRSSLRRER